MAKFSPLSKSTKVSSPQIAARSARDDFARVLDQDRKDLRRLGLQLHDLAVAAQLARRRLEGERPEDLLHTVYLAAAVSRPASTSQNASFVRTPVPSGAGQAMSGSTLVIAVAAGHAWPERLCASAKSQAPQSPSRRSEGAREAYRIVPATDEGSRRRTRRPAATRQHVDVAQLAVLPAEETRARPAARLLGWPVSAVP
jgi:hypothetical protein